PPRADSPRNSTSGPSVETPMDSIITAMLCRHLLKRNGRRSLAGAGYVDSAALARGAEQALHDVQHVECEITRGTLACARRRRRHVVDAIASRRANVSGGCGQR